MDKSEGMVLLLIPSTNSRWEAPSLILGASSCFLWLEPSGICTLPCILALKPVRSETDDSPAGKKTKKMDPKKWKDGGGNSNIFYFQPEPWGNDPIWRAYFSNGLVQPPTSERMVTKFFWVYKCFLMAMFQASGMYPTECFFQDFTGCFSFWWAFKTTFFPLLGNLHES